MAPKSGPLTHGVARTQSLDSALMSLKRAVALRTLSINGDRSLPPGEECCAAFGDVSEGGSVAVARAGIPSVHARIVACERRPRIEFERDGFIIAYLAVLHGDVCKSIEEMSTIQHGVAVDVARMRHQIGSAHK